VYVHPFGDVLQIEMSLPGEIDIVGGGRSAKMGAVALESLYQPVAISSHRSHSLVTMRHSRVPSSQ
jgi:hypothetical protein